MEMLKAFLYQVRHHGFVESFLIDRSGLGIFSKRSHYCKDGTPKISYHHEKTAVLAAQKMSEKYNRPNLRAYKCGFCDSYHIGNAK